MSKTVKVLTSLILMISVIIVYECCMAIDMNNVIHHDINKDIIKFNNIEWLEERENVENKVENLITNTNIKKVNEPIENLSFIYKEEGKYYASRYPDGYIVYNTVITDKKSSNTIIGRIAGWNINNISIEYINCEQEENNQYVFGYSVLITEENNITDYKTIFDDIKEKLTSKYSMCNIRESSSNDKNGKVRSYELYIEDNNNNHIRLNGYSNSKIVAISYTCGDLDQYMKDIIIGQKNEEAEALKQELVDIKKDNEGL